MHFVSMARVVALQAITEFVFASYVNDPLKASTFRADPCKPLLRTSLTESH